MILVQGVSSSPSDEYTSVFLAQTTVERVLYIEDSQGQIQALAESGLGFQVKVL